MKFVCSKEELVKGIGIVLRAVPSKTTMDILTCILVEAEDGRIKLTGNDTELGIETFIEGDVKEKGSMAVDARLFSELVRKLPLSDVTVDSSSGESVTISCGSAVFKIGIRDASQFPEIPYMIRDDAVVMSQFTLKETITRTIFSVAQNETNRIMTGELFEINGSVLRVISLDGHRISIRCVELKEEYESRKVIVPGKTLNDLSRILSGETDRDVMIYTTANHIMFYFDDTTVVSRLIDGSYFKVDQMLTNDYETKITVDKKAFLDSIDRSTLLVREDDKKPIIFDIKDGSVEMRIRSNFGAMNEKIEAGKEGNDIVIGFNPKYLLDALRVIDDETINLYFINPKTPCFIRDNEGSYVYLILPVNFVE